jgi:3-keto-disaccharide hydrolase
VTGSTIVVELNGTRIVDADVAKVTEFMDRREHPGKDRRSGHFGFAGHNDPVAYRNVFVKVLQ